jgi:hypothetical protein
MKRAFGIIAIVLASACGGSTEPFREPSIAFDRQSYTVTLNTAATAVVTKPTPTVTVTRGTNLFAPILSIGLDPAGYCNVGAGVGFANTSAQWTIQGSEPSVSRAVDFNVCPSIVGGQTIPKGNTTIKVTYSQDGKTYTATAVVTVQ